MYRKAIVTGANAGIGFEVANALVRQGFEVTIACRNSSKGAEAAKRISNANFVRVGYLDLSDLESVQHFADSQSGEQPWSLLVNNAGAKIESPLKFTKQNLEWHYGVNLIGHFALTARLLPFATHDARVVSVSSIMARYGQLNQRPRWSASSAYADSKLANLAFGLKLASMFAQTAKTSTIAAPGFARAQPYGPFLTKVSERLLAQSAAAGSIPIIRAASPEIENASYLAPRLFELWSDSAKARIPAAAIDVLEVESAWQRWQTDAGISFVV